MESQANGPSTIGTGIEVSKSARESATLLCCIYDLSNESRGECARTSITCVHILKIVAGSFLICDGGSFLMTPDI